MKRTTHKLVGALATAPWPAPRSAARAALTWAIPLAILLLQTACDSHREFRCPLSPEEAVPIHQPVTLDGRRVGTVAAIRQDGSDRFAVLRITDRAAVSAMRIGVEREQCGGEMRLSSANVQPNAAPLDPNTAIIPTRAPLNHAARTTLDGARELLWRVRDLANDHPLAALAAGVVAFILLLCLLRCCFTRRSCTFLLFILLLAVASSALAASVKRDQVEAEVRRLEGLVTRAEDCAAEARRLAKAGLLLPAQIAGIRAIFSSDRAADTEATCLGNIDRISAWSANADTKAAFRSRYHDARQRRARVEDLVAEVASTAPNAQERLIALYFSQRDRIKLRIREGKADEDQLLRDLSTLAGFPASLIQQKLVSVDNVAEIGLEASGIRLPNGQLFSLSTTTNVGSEQPLWDSKTAAELARLRQQVADELTELRRVRERTNPPVTIIMTNEVRTIIEKPIPAPAPPPIVHFVTNVQRIFVDRPVTNIERVFVTNTPPAAIAGDHDAPSPPNMNLRSQAPSLPLASAAQRARSATDSGASQQPSCPLPGAGLAKTGQGSTIASSVNPPQRPPAPIAANTSSTALPKPESGNLPPKSGIAVALPTQNKNGPVKIAPLNETSNTTTTNALDTRIGAIHTGQSGETTRSTESVSPMRRAQVISAIIVVAGTFALLVLLFGMRIRADEAFVVKLLVFGREREFDVEAGRDAVFLDTEVFCAEKNSPHPCSRILIKRKGAILHPPKRGPSAESGVRVNGAPVSNPCVLQPGDVITLALCNQPDQSLKFLGYAEAVPAVNEGEMDYAPTHTTQ